MNGIPLAPFVARRLVTQREKLAADALGWQKDVSELLTKGAVCTCAPAFRCPLHVRLDFAEGAWGAAIEETARAHSDMAL